MLMAHEKVACRPGLDLLQAHDATVAHAVPLADHRSDGVPNVPAMTADVGA